MLEDKVAELSRAHQGDLAVQAAALLSDSAKVAEQHEQALRAELAQKSADALKSQADAFHAAFETSLLTLSQELHREFELKVNERVDAERGGRLARLEYLALKLKYLQASTLRSAESLDRATRLLRLHAATQALRVALESKRDVTPELLALKRRAESEPFVREILACLPPDAGQQCVPMHALASAYTALEPGLRHYSLLPDRAGPISYTLAKLVAKAYIPRSGLIPGTDIESVLSRTRHYLAHQDLDAAARELNQLKGWAGWLAQDWLAAARSQLEVLQALEVVETHLSLATMNKA